MQSMAIWSGAAARKPGATALKPVAPPGAGGAGFTGERLAGLLLLPAMTWVSLYKAGATRSLFLFLWFCFVLFCVFVYVIVFVFVVVLFCVFVFERINFLSKTPSSKHAVTNCSIT